MTNSGLGQHHEETKRAHYAKLEQRAEEMARIDYKLWHSARRWEMWREFDSNRFEQLKQYHLKTLKSQHPAPMGKIAVKEEKSYFAVNLCIGLILIIFPLMAMAASAAPIPSSQIDTEYLS